MGWLRNLLALIGLLALLGLGIGYAQFRAFMDKLDPEAPRVYRVLAERFMETLDPGSTFVIRRQVAEELTPEDVVDSMKSLAVQYNMLFVGEAPFYKQVQALTGKPYRYIAFYYFCDARVGMEMADYNDAYTAFMPCRISLVEDKEGKFWLYMMDMDPLIFGGKPLPPKLKEDAISVRDRLLKIMEGAAKGEF